jgi:hypothetical protein
MLWHMHAIQRRGSKYTMILLAPDEDVRPLPKRWTYIREVGRFEADARLEASILEKIVFRVREWIERQTKKIRFGVTK